ncbi:ethanolamine ammonia-lyase light chain [Chthoniobacter flavus]|uniref:ethanolamine ammonia-lyase subunit EutC n=1 Tax=Chthoniobacter flavus TaxID=191863 RepID=UPI001046A3F5|nr:ethanolamine ammonia-lyase subunit EutC [Chthoniobacter flavus]TCO89433.1 ethanolamine ammonia-lyase light chain [Chthoniobacter flavus]
MSDELVPADPWSPLRAYTAARIALGRSGGSLPTRAQLDFRLAHARARDAVLAEFDAEALATKLRVLGEPVRVVDSAAPDRAEFLQHPNLGRRLAEASRATLAGSAETTPRCDLAIIVSDGLSTLAATTQTEPVLVALLPLLRGDGWNLAPVIVARHARVALQDEIGEILRAQISLMLLGERPGLGSADSLGAYFTYAPAPGRTDADRNCISNIRTGGLAPAKAARKLHALLTQARQLRVSGVVLKDETVLGDSAPEKPALGSE